MRAAIPCLSRARAMKFSASFCVLKVTAIPCHIHQVPNASFRLISFQPFLSQWRARAAIPGIGKRLSSLAESHLLAKSGRTFSPNPPPDI